MANQVSTDITFADSGANSAVNGARLNALVGDIKLLNGGVIDQIERTIPNAADTVLLGDSTQPDTGAPLKVQVQNLLLDTQKNGTLQFVVTDTGSGPNVYIVTLPFATATLQAGQVLRFKAAHTNTGASTVQVISNAVSLGTPTIKSRSLADLAANDILAGQVVELVYDGTYFQMAFASSSVNAAQTSGAAQYVVDTGAGANVYVATLVPAATAVAAGMVVRFKAIHTNTGASTLNVNGTGAINLTKNGNAALLANDILSGDLVTAVYDGANFQITGRVRSWDFVGTGLAGPANSRTTTAHGLGFIPSKIRVVFYNNVVTADQGYAQNNEVTAESFRYNSTGGSPFAVSADATNVYVSCDNITNPYIVPYAGGGAAAITYPNWKMKIYASL